MKYMNHKKSRVTDLFRKMDKNNEGFIPREDFIDGIMKTSNCFVQFKPFYNHLNILYRLQNSLQVAWK